MSPSPFISSEALVGLESRTLFYPSAGPDCDVPIKLFLPWIDDFWFVDVGYEPHKPFWPASAVEGVSVEEVTSISTKSGARYEVSVRHEHCRHVSGKLFRIHACRGRGYDTLRAVFGLGSKRRTLSVFFHRGDSPGEGGSNFYWLGRKRLRDVLSYLEPGGLIASDGSLAIRHLRKYEDAGIDPISLVTSGESFETAGHTFIVVGYAGQRNGPTLVWKTVQR